MDWLPVGRRRANNGKIPGRHQAELQGTRYGSSGKRQGIYIDLKFAQLFLRRYAKFLFFINDQ